MDAAPPANPPLADRVHALYRRLLALLVTLAGVGYAIDLLRRTATTAITILMHDDPASVRKQMVRFQNSADGPVYESFGLTYQGYAGAGWAIAQFSVIAASVALLLLARGRVRTVASVALLAFGSFWFLNSVFFMIIADPAFFGGFAAYHGIGFACLLVFAISRCRSRARSTS